VKKANQALHGVSKAQELSALRNFALECGLNSYTRSLLSDRLLKWFEAEMASDMSCDLLASYEYALEGARAREASARSEAQLAAHLLSKEQVVSKAAADDAEYLRRVLAQKNEDISVFERDYTELASRNAKLEAELVTLKAHLFDLEHGGAK
jgi:hypothetical protein